MSYLRRVGRGRRLLTTFRRVDDRDRELAALRENVALLRDEAARLRLEREQDLGVRRAAARAQAIRDSAPLAGLPADDAWQCVVEARVARSELLYLCQETRAALSFLEHQLEALIPEQTHDRDEGGVHAEYGRATGNV